jgi:cell division protein FtsL
MAKDKVHPRLLRPLSGDRPNNYLYRLVSSQRFLAIIGLVFLVLIVFPLARVYSQRRLVAQEIAEVQQQIDEFEKQNQNLSEVLSYLQSDQALEEAARLNLNLKKPGEGVVVIEGGKSENDFSANNGATKQESNLSKWWSYFFD